MTKKSRQVRAGHTKTDMRESQSPFANSRENGVDRSVSGGATKRRLAPNRKDVSGVRNPIVFAGDADKLVTMHDK